MKLQAPPVKVWAESRGLPVYQPVRVRDGELERWLLDKAADAALVAAYGRILPAAVLRAPRVGCLNLHASILPKYRGAAPIQWALIRGETETGISLMHMDEGMDTGAVYAVRRMAIPPEFDAGDLTAELAQLGADMVGREVLQVIGGGLQAAPQDPASASAAPPITAEHVGIDWAQSALEIVNRVRGLAPAPGALTFAAGRRLKVLRARVGTGSGRAPGEVFVGSAGLVEVACGRGSAVIERAQPEGGKAQAGRDLLNGRFLSEGQLLEAPRSRA
jgi:methionyl-tRNA formyltransferase